jgi:DDE superfamily endonuclease
MEHNIKLLILPAHSSHCTQPLDISIFSPLKAYLSRALNRVVAAQVTTIQKAEWLEAYVNAKPSAFSKSNVLGGWSGAGLVPFNPQKVIRRVQNATPPPQQISECTTTDAFNMALFDSPVDIKALQQANRQLIDTLAKIPAISSPIRNYTKQLAMRYERLETREGISETEKSNRDSVLEVRKKRESGKRGVLKGLHSIAFAEVLKPIREHEKRTEEQKAKRAKKGAKETKQMVDTGDVDGE